MRLTIDLLRYVAGHINAVRQREICLRGYQIPAIENLGILQDAYDCIDLSDNSIIILGNFPEMKRLITLLLHNNKIKEISKGLGRFAPKLENLMLSNNKIDRVCPFLTPISLHHIAMLADSLSLYLSLRSWLSWTDWRNLVICCD